MPNEMCPMTIIEYMNHLITEAMKTGDKDMLSLFRLIKSEMTKYSKDKGLPDTAIDTQAVYKSMKKRLLEEIDGLEKAGRDVSVQKKHLEWIQNELPKPVSNEEVKIYAENLLKEFPNIDMKNFMANIKINYQYNEIDMKYVSQLAKQLLAKKLKREI